MIKPRSRGSLFFAGLALALLAGCSEPGATSYRHQEQLKALPDKHQKELKEILVRNFGSPVDPRWQSPAPSEPPKEDETQKTSAWTAKVDSRKLLHGANVFQQRCVGCHGETGDGAGPAAEFLDPRPRDYRQGKFKFISTPRGGKPRRADLERIIRRGAKGTSMPAFPFMSEEDMDAVIDYVTALSYRGELELALISFANDELEETASFDPAYVAEVMTAIDANWQGAEDQVVVPVTVMPKKTAETIASGAQIFLSNACVQCHGKEGRGGRSLASDQQIPKDDWGHIAYAADLTSGTLHGGRRPIDLYRRIYAGINGSPMPAFGNTFAENPEKIWHLVHFITHLSEGGEIPKVEVPTETAPAAASESPPAADAPKGDAP